MSWRGHLRRVGMVWKVGVLEFGHGNMQAKFRQPVLEKTTVSTITTAGVVAYTAAQLLGGLILRDPAGAARADTPPTAANMIAAIKNPRVGDSFEFIIQNDGSATEDITVSAATGVTLAGTMTVDDATQKRFKVVVTSATTYTLYSLGQVVH